MNNISGHFMGDLSPQLAYSRHLVCRGAVSPRPGRLNYIGTAEISQGRRKRVCIPSDTFHVHFWEGI